MTAAVTKEAANKLADEMWHEYFPAENIDEAVALGMAIEQLFERAKMNGSTGTLLVGSVVQRREAGNKK